MHLSPSPVRVAVIDSGWNGTPADPRVLPGIDFTQRHAKAGSWRNSACDRVGHGTRCIERILNIAPHATVNPIRIFDGDLTASPAQLLAAIGYACDDGATIINLSLGVRAPAVLPKLFEACQEACDRGVVIVAAGDNGRNRAYPAALPNVIGVRAGCFGSLGYIIYSDDALSLECIADGRASVRSRATTSVAAATVSGLLALLLPKACKGISDAREVLRQQANPRLARAVTVAPFDAAALPVPRAERTAQPESGDDNGWANQ
jgi:serine protease